MDEYNNYPKIIAELHKLDHLAINVGVLHDNFLQMIAVVNNDGTVIHAKKGKYLMIPKRGGGFIQKESVTIPARRFMEKTIIRHSAEWQEVSADMVAKLASGGDMTALNIAHTIGGMAVKQMKREIIDFKEPHNSAFTIANKGKDDPLVDTGALRDAINYEIVEI